MCVPYGVPTMMSVAIYPVEIIQTPKQVTIIAEAFSEVRRVYMDRPQAKIEDVAPGYYGRSVGHWEGDTLVVDTVGIKTSVNGYRGMPHSDQMRVTERFQPGCAGYSARPDHHRRSGGAGEADDVHAGLQAHAELRDGRVCLR